MSAKREKKKATRGGRGWPAEGSAEGDSGGWGEGSFLLGPGGTKPRLLVKGDSPAWPTPIPRQGVIKTAGDDFDHRGASCLLARTGEQEKHAPCQSADLFSESI